MSMSVETRLDNLESQHKQIDANQHSLAKICADIKNIALTNQHDIASLKVDVAGIKTDIGGLKTDIHGVKACIAALAEATHAGFRRTDEQHNELVQEVREFKQETRERFDRLEQETREFKQETRERFDQLELLIRQSLPSN